MSNLLCILKSHKGLKLNTVKSYSHVSTSGYKNLGKFCNLKNTVNKKYFSNKETPYDFTKAICSSRCTEETNIKKKKISVAIIGGGCNMICTTILLKQNPAIKDIRLIDTDDTLTGPVCDIRQIDTSTRVKHYRRTAIIDGLRNADIVALMDESDFLMGNKGPFSQFISSCNYVKNVSECIINGAPNAIIAVFVRPVTATLPLVSEIFKYSRNWDPNKIIGSASLEEMRIASMTASLFDLDPSSFTVPLSGGVDSVTVVPLLSRTQLFSNSTEEVESMLVTELRSADKHLHDSEAKGPTVSSGLAAAKFISILINGLNGEKPATASAYVRSDILPSCLYMTSEIKFGPKGIQKNYGLPKLSSREILLVEQAAIMINKIVRTSNLFIHTGKLK